MSIQIFLQGKLQGIGAFLGGPAGHRGGPDSERLFSGRCWYVSLLCEVLPRALLNEFGLAKILLGSSGGGQFLVVLPQAIEREAAEFLAAAARDVRTISSGRLDLIWSSTENLGDWSVVRRRLREALAAKRCSPARDRDPSFFEPFDPVPPEDYSGYFRDTLEAGMLEGKRIGWSAQSPGLVLAGDGKYSWTLGPGPEQIPFSRHIALTDDGLRPATTLELAARAEGAPLWGVLRADVDNLDIRFRRIQSIEEHVQLSVLYKQFFAGELEVLCSMPEFWRKVTVLYAGGDDFAACGSWDALIQLGREMQRLFRRFSEEYLKDFPGAEGKTISMALALAPEPDCRLESVYEEAGRMLEAAKCTSRDCFSLLGRVLEWRQLHSATDLKDIMVRVVREFGGSTQFLRELASFYREDASAPYWRPRREGELERPWRLHRRVLRVLPAARDRERERLRSSLITELVGKRTAQVQLRPAGRVALEWARLLTEAERNA